jgi:acyl carrier protein
MAFKFEEKLKEVISICCNDINIENINEDTDLVNDCNFTSINIVQLVVELENTFNIEIDDENLSIEKLASYKSLVEILHLKLSEDNIY